MGLSEQDSNLNFSDGADDDDDSEGSPIEMTLVHRRQKDSANSASMSRSKRRAQRKQSDSSNDA